jgi:hypothetical protein
MLNGTAEGGMALPGDHCLRVDSRQLFIAHPSPVNPGSSPAEKGRLPGNARIPGSDLQSERITCGDTK